MQFQNILIFLSLVSNLQGTDLNLMKDDIYNLHWDIDQKTQEIHVTLDVKHDGWVGFGLSADGQMANSDIVICKTTDGRADCTDRWATKYALPQLDTEQGGSDDLTNVSGVVKNGRHIYKFTRKLSTGDSKDIEIIKGTSQFILYSIGTQDSDRQFTKHSQKGSVEQILC